MENFWIGCDVLKFLRDNAKWNAIFLPGNCIARYFRSTIKICIFVITREECYEVEAQVIVNTLSFTSPIDPIQRLLSMAKLPNRLHRPTLTLTASRRIERSRKRLQEAGSPLARLPNALPNRRSGSITKTHHVVSYVT